MVWGLTKGGRCCQLFGSPPPLLSLRTKEISIMRAAPAAMSVYPKTEWTIVLSISSCGWADIAQPVKKITMPGMTFRLGRPPRLLLSQTPRRPAHHQTMPMLVCWRSFLTHGWPQRCSVKVLTQPQRAMTTESKNSWLFPVFLIHAWPTSSMMVITMPYPMKALPMMKCARHCPRWSPRQ